MKSRKWWGTTPPYVTKVVKRLAERYNCPISNDSIEVIIRIAKIERNEVEFLLKEGDVRSVISVQDAGQWWVTSVHVSVPQIESLAENDNVLSISLPWPPIEDPTFKMEELPLPPGH